MHSWTSHLLCYCTSTSLTPISPLPPPPPTEQHYADVRPRIKGRFVSPEEFDAWKAEQAAAEPATPSAAAAPAAADALPPAATEPTS